MAIMACPNLALTCDLVFMANIVGRLWGRNYKTSGMIADIMSMIHFDAKTRYGAGDFICCYFGKKKKPKEVANAEYTVLLFKGCIKIWYVRCLRMNFCALWDLGFS